MRIHKVGIDEFKVDSYWMKLKTPIFEAKLSLNLTKIKLKIKKNKLICKIKPEAKSLMDKEVERRLKNFANASNLNYEIV